MKYHIVKEQTGGAVSLCLMSDEHIEPLVVATAVPIRNRIELRITDKARKHGCNPQLFYKVPKIAKGVIEEIEERAIALLQPQTVLVTGCGAKKHEGIRPAQELYKSGRITFAKRLAAQKNIPLFILSAEHGMICGEDLIAPYDRKMDRERSNELLNTVKCQIRYARIESIVFFAAGVNKHYRQLLERAARELDIEFRAIGTGCMGGAKELPALLDIATGKKPETGCELVAPVVSKDARGQLLLF